MSDQTWRRSLLRVIAAAPFCLLLSACTSLAMEVSDYHKPLPSGQGVLLISVDTDRAIQALQITDAKSGASDAALQGIPAGRSLHAVMLPAGDYDWSRIDWMDTLVVGLTVETSWVDLAAHAGRHLRFAVKAGTVSYGGDLVIRNIVVNPAELDVPSNLPGVTEQANARTYTDLVDRSTMVLTALSPEQMALVGRVGFAYTGPGSDGFPSKFLGLAPGGTPSGAPSVADTSASTSGAPSLDPAVFDRLYGRPYLGTTVISPDGRLVLMATYPRGSDAIQLTLIDLNTKTKADVYLLPSSGGPLTGLAWVSGDTAVFMDRASPTGKPELVALRWRRTADGHPDLGVMRWPGAYSPTRAAVRSDDHVILEQSTQTPDGVHACLLRADLDPGPGLLALHDCTATLPLNSVAVLLDSRDDPYVVMTLSLDRKVHVERAAKPGDAATGWVEFKQYPMGKDIFVPEAIAADGHNIFVLSNLDRTTAGYFEYDPVDDRIVRAVHADDASEVNDVHVDPERQAVTYLRVRTNTGVRFEAEDDRTRDGLVAMEKAFPGDGVIPEGASADGSVMLGFVFADTEPGAYYSFDRKTGEKHLLGEWLPGLDTAHLAHIRSGSVTLADGNSVGYLLTLPPSATGRSPVVVIPVDGATDSFDARYFDSDAQFLAGEGYAVLKVNYRGSRGDASVKQTVTDFVENLAAVVSRVDSMGALDRSRVCLYGVHRGGYVALLGVIRHPELFRCVFSNSAVTDLSLLRNSVNQDENAAEREAMAKLTGVTLDDATKLDALSPARLADAIHRPIFLAQDTNDLEVDQEQGFRLKAALEREGKPVEYWTYSGRRGVIDMKFVAAYSPKLLAFLAENLGAAAAGTGHP